MVNERELPRTSNQQQRKSLLQEAEEQRHKQGNVDKQSAGQESSATENNSQHGKEQGQAAGQPRDYAASPYHIRTVRHLEDWTGQEPQDVVDAIQALLKDNQETTDLYNASILENAELREQVSELRQLNKLLRRDKINMAEIPHTAEESIRSTPRVSTVITSVESGNNFRKTTKLPDPAVFTNGQDPTIDDWLSKIRNKLLANSDHYPTEIIRIAYVETRVGGDAAKHLAPRLRLDARKPFTTAEEIFQYLERVYGDPNRKHTALTEFRKLRQGMKEFNGFWADFQRLSAELDHNEETLIEELRDKLSIEIQRQLATGEDDPADLYDFARRCQRIDQRLRDVKQHSQRIFRSTTTTSTTTRETPTLRSTSGPQPQATLLTRNETRPPVRPTPTPLPRLFRVPDKDPDKEQMLQEGRCFVCQ